MKTNGLRNKKPQCARAAWRSWKTWVDFFGDRPGARTKNIDNWHRATWRK